MSLAGEGESSDEEALLLEQFKQQQILLDALARTNHQLLAARDEALLAEKMQTLSMCVMEIRPDTLRKKRTSYDDEDEHGSVHVRRRQDYMVDDLCADDIVYRSAGGDFSAELAAMESPAYRDSVSDYAGAIIADQPTALQQQVQLLSQILVRLQETALWDDGKRAGDAIAELQGLSAQMVGLASQL